MEENGQLVQFIFNTGQVLFKNKFLKSLLMQSVYLYGTKREVIAEKENEWTMPVHISYAL